MAKTRFTHKIHSSARQIEEAGKALTFFKAKHPDVLCTSVESTSDVCVWKISGYNRVKKQMEQRMVDTRARVIEG